MTYIAFKRHFNKNCQCWVNISCEVRGSKSNLSLLLMIFRVFQNVESC